MRVLAVATAIAVLIAVLLPFQIVALLFKLPARRTIPVFFHRAICRLLNMRVRVIGELAAGPALIVANHTSWLDICAFSSVAPVIFVAKREVATWPLFGQLARLARSVFIDRTRRSGTASASRAIAALLAEGERVVLFAEGTSNDGGRVLPFRSSLLAAARAAPEGRAPLPIALQPTAIVYTALAGLPLNRRCRPRVAWYGDLDLLPHLATVIRGGGIDVVIHAGRAVNGDAILDRKIAAQDLEAQVRALRLAVLRAPLPQ
ncbi:MAG: lysophospholipid acyltransferase family protein [Variibacter sp.]